MSLTNLFIIKKTSRRLLMVGALGLAIALVFAACQPPDEPGSTVSAPADSTSSNPASTAMVESTAMQEPGTNMYADLAGDIDIDGSSTVFPITEAVAEEFGDLSDGNVRTVVGISGTGGGFKKFCTGETVISDASRPIKQKEVDLCAAEGVEYIEIPVAIDGLSVLVNPANEFVECLSVDQLNLIWSPDSEGVVMTWDQVDPSWPEEAINLYAPGVDSGTFDYFTEAVNGDGGVSRGDFVASEDDNVLVQGISGDEFSLGYFGYAYYVENQERLKVVPIDGGAGCIAPTDEAINNGSYAPLSRPLFIYVRADAAQKDHVAEFVRYYLSKNGRRLAASVGYIPFPEGVYNLGLAKFEARTTGTVFGGDNAFKGPVAEGLTK